MTHNFKYRKFRIIISIISCFIFSSCSHIGNKNVTDPTLRKKISDGMTMEEIEKTFGNKYGNYKYIKPSQKNSYREYGFISSNFFYKNTYDLVVFFDEEKQKSYKFDYDRSFRPLPWITTKSLLRATFCPTYNPDCM